eukprot:scaffold62941_cov16-Tisochrysis_lutea.AAC.1
MLAAPPPNSDVEAVDWKSMSVIVLSSCMGVGEQQGHAHEVNGRVTDVLHDTEGLKGCLYQATTSPGIRIKDASRSRALAGLYLPI